MSHWKPRALLLRLALPVVLIAGASTGAILLSLPAAATAALPAPGQTQCSGSLTAAPDAALLEPDNFDYSFYCSNEISAYSIIVDRVNDDGDNIDNYNGAPEVIDAGQVSTTQSVQCGGTSPSNGIDCYALNGSTAGEIGPGYSIGGSVDLTNPYCSYLPKGARPGTPAVPRAIVELVVTDNSGATDGPFELFPTKACKPVPAVVPAPKTKKKTATSKKTTRTTRKATITE